MSPQSSDKTAVRPGRWSDLFKDRHFLVAAGILLVAAVGFNYAVNGLHIWLTKQPVPPPAIAKFEDQRLVSFPEHLGGLYMLSKGIKGIPDGVIKEKKANLEELGTLLHPMNWYYSGFFQDDPKAKMAMRLDLTYYTGLLDAVAHVPTNCIVAGGGTIIDDQSGSVEMQVPSVPAPWSKINVQRTAWATRDEHGVEHRYFQYYLFSLNGRPSDSRYQVREVLMHPLKKYCYFAKIQVAPTPLAPGVPDLDPKTSDELCRDFLMYALPDILKYLPSEQDIRQLESGVKAGAE